MIITIIHKGHVYRRVSRGLPLERSNSFRCEQCGAGAWMNGHSLFEDGDLDDILGLSCNDRMVRRIMES